MKEKRKRKIENRKIKAVKKKTGKKERIKRRG